MQIAEEIFGLWREDQAEKRRALPRSAGVGKVRPTALRFPPTAVHWREAPDLVRVDLVTGRVLVFRWPLE